MQSISLKTFLYTLKESTANRKRFCFILGAGASKESGIRTGVELARLWHAELLEKYTPQELDVLARGLGITDLSAKKEDYSDMFYLSFHPEFKNGHSFLEREMEKAQPSFGYYHLAMHLASTQNNLVITTNFDSLVEDALFIYTQKKPLVASHEMLAPYVSINTNRPIVAKIHRGLFLDPHSKPTDVKKLHDEWACVLSDVLKVYTPIVIGYAGGDGSLMNFLSDSKLETQGIYWCYMEGEEPSANIQKLVKDKEGSFVPISGFDEMMYLLGDAFSYPSPEKNILAVANERVDAYNEKFNKFSKKLKEVENPTPDQSEILDSLNRRQRQLLQDMTDHIDKNPQDPYAYVRRADVYKFLEQYDNALSDYSAAIDLEPEEADTYLLRALLHSKRNDFSTALKDLCTAIELDPEAAIYYYFRADAYEKLGDDNKALSDYSTAIELGLADSLYYAARAKVYARLGEPEKANADYKRAQELESDYDALLNRFLDEQETANPKAE